MNLRRENIRMVGKLLVITCGMFAFGYALVPIYKAICEATGINILALSERNVPGQAGTSALGGRETTLAANTQIDKSRSEQDIVRCPAGDALAAASIVVNVLDRGGRFKNVGLCLGTKPHAIGFGMAALIRPDFTLVCRLPDRYVETETPASGFMWSYDLRDLSVAADISAC